VSVSTIIHETVGGSCKTGTAYNGGGAKAERELNHLSERHEIQVEKH
jgi:hypothetical protein